MTLSDEPIIPTEPTPPPKRDAAALRSRRRRANRREMFPVNAEGQATFISELSRRAYPSVELFVFSLTCGAILGLGFFLDSQAVLLLGILAAPLMVPWVGFLLAILTGSPRFLFETFAALLISGVLVFLGGLLIGVVIRFIPPRTLTAAYDHSHLWIPELVVLVVGAITLVASFVRSESKPFLPSILIAYVFYLPINAAGFGLGSGLTGIWPQAIFVFATHFALASVVGLLTLFVLRLRPTLQGIFFSTIALLLFAVILVIFMGSGLPSNVKRTEAVAASSPTTQPSPLPASDPTSIVVTKTTSSPRPSSASIPALTDSVTPTSGTVTVTTTATITSTAATATGATSLVLPTLPATETPTVTLTLEPQTISGTISASEGGGANLRQTPNGKYLLTLDNGTIVEIYPDFKQVNGVAWIHVIVTRNGQRVEGWLLESVVSYATPEPNFEPTATP
jgi:hypothetical protein